MTPPFSEVPFFSDAPFSLTYHHYQTQYRLEDDSCGPDGKRALLTPPTPKGSDSAMLEAWMHKTRLEITTEGLRRIADKAEHMEPFLFYEQDVVHTSVIVNSRLYTLHSDTQRKGRMSNLTVWNRLDLSSDGDSLSRIPVDCDFSSLHSITRYFSASLTPDVTPFRKSSMRMFNRSNSGSDISMRPLPPAALQEDPDELKRTDMVRGIMTQVGSCLFRLYTSSLLFPPISRANVCFILFSFFLHSLPTPLLPLLFLLFPLLHRLLLISTLQRFLETE